MRIVEGRQPIKIGPNPDLEILSPRGRALLFGLTGARYLAEHLVGHGADVSTSIEGISQTNLETFRVTPKVVKVLVAG